MAPHRLGRSTTSMAVIALLGLAVNACGSGSTTAPSGSLSIPPSASAVTAEAGAGDPVPDELRSRWMGGHRDVPGIEPTAGTTIVFSEGAFSLTQSNGIEDELLRSAATSVGRQLRLESSSDGEGCKEDDVGVYDWSLSSSGRILTMTADEDVCSTRLAAVPGVWWRMGCKDPGGDTCLGDLDPGTYKSQFIGPRVDPGAEWSSDFGALTYTVPDGWANTGDYPRTFSLMLSSDYATVQGDAPGEDASIFLYTQPVAISQELPCADGSEPGVERTVDAEMAWVRQLDGLVTTEPMPIVIDGNPGLMTDLSVDPARVAECDELEYLLAEEPIAIAHNQRQRLILLDLGEGDVLGIRIFTRDPARFDAFVAEAMSVIESFKFE